MASVKGIEDNSPERIIKDDQEAEEMSPEAVAPSPKAGKPSSKAEKPSSKAEKPSSKAEKPSSKAEKPSSKAEKPSSKAEKPSPKAEKASSKAEKASPKAEKASPKAEKASSKAEKASPKAEKASPKAEKASPKAEKASPKAEKASPKAEESSPKAEESSPKAEESSPKAEESSPKAEEPSSAAKEPSTETESKTEKTNSGTEQSDSAKSKSGSEPQLGKTVAQHYNELKDAGLDIRGNSRIFYLRNFNNWIKSVLIGNTLQKIRDEKGNDYKTAVLDMCSGKGGDILKWKKGRISKLVCVDIAATSVDQSKVRYKDMVDRSQNNKRREQTFDAEFITADVTKERLKTMYKDQSIKFDLVSCQFAFHYSFESYPQADMMLKNTAECLQPGGYFIGTTPNSYELVNRLRASDKNSFGNDVFKIEFVSENKDNFPIFGSQYSFQLEEVVDCPEFLVYFPVLEKMAEKYGLKLVAKKTFADFFNENYDLTHENRSLLGRMQALEPYPAETEVKLMSTEAEDYSPAKEALEKATSSQDSHRRPLKVGTLSKAEWEAINLYMVFVFQKPKPEKVAKPASEATPAATEAPSAKAEKRRLSDVEAGDSDKKAGDSDKKAKTEEGVPEKDSKVEAEADNKEEEEVEEKMEEAAADDDDDAK